MQNKLDVIASGRGISVSKVKSDKKDALNFKISSALKNLIGKELITDQFIAIFELVKNSFDAHAKWVKIVFPDEPDSRILIIDNGKGMNIEDIKNKWLFVAYSAKKDGTEDLNISQGDYRNQIQNKRIFAGAKGVGRFSCDRLGGMLNLITIKDEANALIQQLIVNWEAFEENAKQEFIVVPITHKILSNTEYTIPPYNITHGTILELSNLRDAWTRENLIKLKRSLEKLINPNQGNDYSDFSIEIIAPGQSAFDNLEKQETNRVNGLVKNNLFERLGLKTTQITTEISSDGDLITTSLTDRGKLIYRIVEKNPFELHDISVNLFQLNRSAKIQFHKIMGIHSVQFGSVLLYKNGFRIYPFGEEGEDTLGIDRRKQQGYARFLGTRDLIGRIEINGDNPGLQETTSRDGGLIKNKHYNQLTNFFDEKALRRLEKYVVEVIKWGDPVKKEDGTIGSILEPEDVTEQIAIVIKNLSRSKEIIEVEYDKDFLKIIDERQEKSASALFKNLKRKAAEIDYDFLKETEKAERHFKELLSAKVQAEEEVERKSDELQQTTAQLEQSISQNLFLSSVSTVDTKEFISLQHQIDHGTHAIGKNLDRLALAIKENSPKEELFSFIDKISFENQKISTVARFVTKANFNTMSQSIEQDLVQFVNEYIENVYKEYFHLKTNNQLLQVSIETPPNLLFNRIFKPLEVIIIIDNLFSNAFKADAKNMFISWHPLSQNKVQIKFRDDGKGIKPEIISRIFDFGFTTTHGSGLGLYHIKQIIERMKGKVFVNRIEPKGAEFILEVSR